MENYRITYRRRFFSVAKIFLLIVLDFRKEYFLTKKHGYKYSQKKMEKTHGRRARQLYDVAITLEGAMIKLCQYFSTRRDIFPEAYIKILAPLQDHVPAIPFSDIEAVLTSEYGDYGRHFASIDEVPLASASLGQIHKAKLHSREEVVLKILKPRVENLVDVDFAILFHTFRLLSYFKLVKEKADLFSLLDEFIRVTGDELNFRREIAIAKLFRKDLSKFTYLQIPLMYGEFCTKKVIVMEYLAGDKINEIDTWIKRNNDPVKISRRLIEIYADQILTNGLIHFDPHPGNILVRDNSNLVLLDFGMSGFITRKMKNAIGDALEAIVKRDYRKMVDIIDDLGFIRKGVNKYSLLSIVEFFFEKIFETIKLDRESVQTVDFSPIRDELVEIIYSHPFVLPTEWAYIGKTLSSLVWVVAMLNPDFKVYDELMPYADRILKKSRDQIIRKSLENVKGNVKIILSLMGRINNLIESLERGYYRIKIDYGEIHDKIDEFKVFLIKFVACFVSFSGVVGSYIFYAYGRSNVAIFIGIISILSLVFAVRFRMRFAKDRIKKYF